MADGDSSPAAAARSEITINIHSKTWPTMLRLTRVTTLFVGHLSLAAVEHLRTAPPSRRAVFGARVRRLVEALGPAPMKVAQILATRRDVLPPWICDALRGTWDDTEPVPAADVLERVAGDERFDSRFPPRLLGSGAIASVYRVRMSDGTDLAVKVLRPGVEAAVQTDLAIIRSVATLLGGLPCLRGVPLREMVEHTCDGIRGQLDLRAEARSLSSLAASLAEVDLIKIPAVRHDLSSDRALVMEVMAEPHAQEGSAPPEAAEQILHAVYHMLFTTGLVHLDLHPGNLSVRRDSVVIFDAGFVVSIEDAVRKRLAEFFLGLALNDGVCCADSIVDSAVRVGPDFDRPRFTEDVRLIVRRFSRLPAERFSLVDLATALFDVQRRHHLFAESSFIFPLLSLLTIEGQIRELSPTLDFQGLAVPYVMRAAATIS